MKWLENCYKKDTLEEIRELSMGHKKRNIVIGEPQATQWMSIDEMKKKGLVGLYE